MKPVLGVVHGVFLYGHIPDLGHRHILSIAGLEVKWLEVQVIRQFIFYMLTLY